MQSTLSLTYSDLKAAVGTFLGWGRGADFGDIPWTDKKKLEIDACVKSGLSQFYIPPPLENETASYDWSFLRPTTTVTLASGASTVALPDDLGGVEGSITVLSSTSRVWLAFQIVNENLVRAKYSEWPNLTGPPQIASLQWLRGDAQGQKVQLFIFPIADRDYRLQFAYYVNPDYLSTAFPYHMGGMPHAETVLESCLAIAEQRLDDAMTVHSAKFKERLIASVNSDRKMKPQLLGYNGDRSDDRAWNRQWNHWTNPILIYGTVH
jgi:hypothetical protein